MKVLKKALEARGEIDALMGAPPAAGRQESPPAMWRSLLDRPERSASTEVPPPASAAAAAAAVPPPAAAAALLPPEEVELA